jgi:hypothetical protein
VWDRWETHTVLVANPRRLIRRWGYWNGCQINRVIGRGTLDSTIWEYGLVADSCGGGNEPKGSIKCVKFLYQLSDLLGSEEGLCSMDLLIRQLSVREIRTDNWRCWYTRYFCTCVPPIHKVPGSNLRRNTFMPGTDIPCFASVSPHWNQPRFSPSKSLPIYLTIKIIITSHSTFCKICSFKCSRNLKGRDNFEDTEVDGRIILKLSSKK